MSRAHTFVYVEIEIKTRLDLNSFTRRVEREKKKNELNWIRRRRGTKKTRRKCDCVAWSTMCSGCLDMVGTHTAQRANTVESERKKNCNFLLSLLAPYKLCVSVKTERPCVREMRIVRTIASVLSSGSTSSKTSCSLSKIFLIHILTFYLSIACDPRKQFYGCDATKKRAFIVWNDNNNS